MDIGSLPIYCLIDERGGGQFKEDVGYAQMKMTRTHLFAVS